MVVFNWNLGSLTDSMGWFEDRGHRQIIAGYYDSGDGAASAEAEQSQAQGFSSLTGAMYTTWNDDYSQLESYAQAWRDREDTP